MKLKIRELENELGVLEWYHEVLEKGIDTKKIMMEYALLSREHRVLKKESKVSIKELKIENSKLILRIESAL